jgi:hypothetical protein
MECNNHLQRDCTFREDHHVAMTFLVAKKSQHKESTKDNIVNTRMDTLRPIQVVRDRTAKPKGENEMSKKQEQVMLKVRKTIAPNHNETALKVRKSLHPNHNETALRIK